VTLWEITTLDFATPASDCCREAQGVACLYTSREFESVEKRSNFAFDLGTVGK